MDAELKAQLAYSLTKEIIAKIDPITILESGEIRSYIDGRLVPFAEAKISKYIEDNKYDLNTPDFYNKVIHHVKARTSITLAELSQPSKYINLKNGMLDLDSFQLLEHTRETATLIQYPIVYDPKAGCKSFLKVLHEIQPFPDIQYRILKSWAACFDMRCMKRQADLWIGEHDTGKTTLARVLLHLLGRENVSLESLQALAGEDPYAKAQLFQKVANISFDLSQIKIEEAGDIKTLLGGDPIRGRFIYGKPFEFLPYQKVFALCNIPPETDEKLHNDLAFWERFRITFFKRQFMRTEQDESLIDEVEPERSKLINEKSLSGIFNILVRILYNIRKSRDYGYTFNGPETRNTWLSQVDYVRKWMNEQVVIGLDLEVPTLVLRNSWDAWRIKKEVADPGLSEFNQIISRFGKQTTGKIKEGGSWRSVKIWKGLTLKALAENTTLGNTTLNE